MLTLQRLACAATLVSLASLASAQTCLTTLFASDNGGSPGGAVYFDLAVSSPAGLTFVSMETNTSVAVGQVCNLEVWITPGTSLGKETNQGLWNMVATGRGFSAGNDSPTVIAMTDFSLPAGTYGVAIVALDFNHRYTNGTGGNQGYSDARIALRLGTASNVPFTAPTFDPRVWNGTLCYGPPCPPPVAYCTAGTTSSGCNAQMGFLGIPTLSNSVPFTLTCINVEGNKNGIFFYGISGRSSAPWGNSTSLLCVKAPTQRMNPPVGSGGAPGTCGGTYANDWNAYVAANPGKAINMAMMAGNLANAQAWFRDPAAGTGPVGAKGTALSNGLEFTVWP